MMCPAIDSPSSCEIRAENDFGFDCLERYHKHSDENLSHIVRVTADKTWVSFVNVETKEQSTGCTHIHQTGRKKLMATVFWDRKEC
jgi:hypothetical protein